MERVTETELIEKNTAPRVTEKDLEDNIVGVSIFNAGEAAAALGQPVLPSQNLLTLCVITLKNGFTVMGESACASPENFNREIGARLAYNHAKGKIWPLMGYHLRQKLSEQG